MAVPAIDWSMGAGGEPLIEWQTASTVGRGLAGRGPLLSALDRARLTEDFGELVPDAASLVLGFTGLPGGAFHSRAWVMNRAEWVDANLRSLQRILDPFARRFLGGRRGGPTAGLRRQLLGAQMGVLMGYVARKVLGQYDVFLPPDDDGLLYFVGPNVTAVERRYRLRRRDFRLWLSLHEVAHRIQFATAPWLRGYLSRLVESYLSTMELDPRRLLEAVKEAVHRARAGEPLGPGLLFLLMSPEQRDTFQRMQALMSLLEGHATYVMNGVAGGRVRGVARMRRALRERRRAFGMERTLQRLIGFDTKVRQYDRGERFVAHVVERVGMEGFNRVWQQEENLPTLAEVGEPDRWLARVAGR